MRIRQQNSKRRGRWILASVLCGSPFTVDKFADDVVSCIHLLFGVIDVCFV